MSVVTAYMKMSVAFQQLKLWINSPEKLEIDLCETYVQPSLSIRHAADSKFGDAWRIGEPVALQSKQHVRGLRPSLSWGAKKILSHVPHVVVLLRWNALDGVANTRSFVTDGT